MTAGSDIAAEITAALAEAGAATGDGTFICTLKRPASGAGEPQNPWDAETGTAGSPTYYDLTAIQNSERVRDASGTLIGGTRTVLTVAAGGAVPGKADRIALGIAKADIDENTAYRGISEVVPVAIGGVDLMYKVTLED